jgi:pimeloyl-ACP methyl ester carboxylesterase
LEKLSATAYFFGVDGDRTMTGSGLIDEWRRQGRVLEVEGANTVLWRMGHGEAVICLHGVPTSGFLYRKLLPELASRNLEGITLDLPGLGLADRPAEFDYRWSGLAAWCLKAFDAAGIKTFHLVVHDIGGPIGFDIIRRVPDRISSLTVLNTLVDVSSFRRPWVMEPFAWPVIGPLWLQSTRTPLFHVLAKTFGAGTIGRAEADAYGQLLLGSDNGRAFLQIMRGFERTVAFERRIKAALKARTFPAQIIWGKDDPALRMKTYVPHLLKALDLRDYEAVDGRHYLQEDASAAIASFIAALIARPGEHRRVSPEERAGGERSE